MRLILIAGFVALLAVPAAAEEISCDAAELRVPRLDPVVTALENGANEDCYKTDVSKRSVDSGRRIPVVRRYTYVNESSDVDMSLTLWIATKSDGSVETMPVADTLHEDEWFDGAEIDGAPFRVGSYEVAKVDFSPEWMCLIAEGGSAPVSGTVGYRQVRHITYCQPGTEPLSDSTVESVIRAADEAFARVQ